jgi:GST-like protein
MSSATPVARTLAELGVVHEEVRLDLSARDQKKPEFLALNPNGKVPTLVVDGTPMFEALAIMQWLGDRYGVHKGLWPAAESPDRLPALAWTTWAYVTYGTLVVLLQRSTSDRLPKECHNPALAEHARSELQHLLNILEERLTKHSFMLGDSYSLVDLIVGGVVAYGQFFGTPLDATPHVNQWLNVISARPAFRAGM